MRGLALLIFKKGFIVLIAGVGALFEKLLGRKKTDPDQPSELT